MTDRRVLAILIFALLVFQYLVTHKPPADPGCTGPDRPVPAAKR